MGSQVVAVEANWPAGVGLVGLAERSGREPVIEAVAGVVAEYVPADRVLEVDSAVVVVVAVAVIVPVLDMALVLEHHKGLRAAAPHTLLGVYNLVEKLEVGPVYVLGPVFVFVLVLGPVLVLVLVLVLGPELEPEPPELLVQLALEPELEPEL